MVTTWITIYLQVMILSSHSPTSMRMIRVMPCCVKSRLKGLRFRGRKRRCVRAKRLMKHGVKWWRSPRT